MKHALQTDRQAQYENNFKKRCEGSKSKMAKKWNEIIKRPQMLLD